MRWRPILWLLVSLACFLGAFYFWRLGEQWRAEKRPGTTAPQSPSRSEASPPSETVTPASTAPLALLSLSLTNKPVALSPLELLHRYRVSNTTQSVGELSRSDNAILLQTALIDVSRPLNLAIPDSLKSTNDPGAYIVQSRGPATEYFRAQLRGAGSAVVSYIPNNAYLIRASAVVAQALASMPAVQAVIPYEPYYKIPNLKLLATAVDGRPLPPDTLLNVVAFPDSREETLAALNKSGIGVIGEDQSPFGTVFKVRPPKDSLTLLAGMPGVQEIGPASARTPANDLGRARLGVAVDSVAETNYNGLSGKNVMVDVNDSGVDASHPDLGTARVFGDLATSLTDTNGHGTHVAGIIGSSGGKSLTVTNASGSIMPATNLQFRGMASNVTLYAVSVFASTNGPAPTDFQLQERAARTNALISNNSWNYNGSDYDIAAASFDAAVRDSLPEDVGSQPVTFVFSAGNAGDGDQDGTGISGGSIQSPATAKNVITVGAIEQLRNITNETQTITPTGTNVATPWAGQTDSDAQVASFSSRGNVGVDIEGDFGRAKPDVVAPGTFVVSTTEKDHWDQASYYNPTNHHFVSFIDNALPSQLRRYALPLPYNMVDVLTIGATAIYPDLPLLILYRKLGLPTFSNYDLQDTNQVVVQPGTGPADYGPVPATRFYGVGNTNNRSVRYEVGVHYTTTNDLGNYFEVLSNMNNQLGPYYRYESGTSMSAAEVSGILALMGDYFTNTPSVQMRPSPALLKAMLINGARTVNDMYDLKVRKTLNDQGWGLANVTNSVPIAITNGLTAGNPKASLIFFEQDPTNALATGESRTFTIQVNTNSGGGDQPLRVTLAWTDPPGNPVAGIKLVNDLDLVVTNLDDTNLVYYGNDIPAGSSFTFPTDTNAPPVVDNVNNIENVYVVNPVASKYSITVFGHRVNVNAVTGHPDNVAQDYALVVSSGDGLVRDAISLSATNALTVLDVPNVTIMTNQFATNAPIAGQILLHQRTGASSPLLGANKIGLGTNTVWGPGGTNADITLGVTNQWHFYTITNTTTFTNAAFGTFLPTDLGLPRMGVTNYTLPGEATRVQADIDLYVSTDPALFSLDPNAVSNAVKSVKRGGTETLFLTTTPGAVYYIGVKAEDQQAAEYGFFGLFSLNPFGQRDPDGFYQCYTVPELIPDGSPDRPGGTKTLLILVPDTFTIRRAVVKDIIAHDNMGDLVGSLSHEDTSVILNNHSCALVAGVCATNHTFVYDDSGEGDFNGVIHPNLPPSQPTDGPGSLTVFDGEEASGQWWLTEVDNALGNTGEVDDFRVRLDPIAEGTNGTILDIQPHSFGYLAVDVPPEATNMTICVENLSATPLQMQLYVRRGELPTLTTFDFTRTINPPGDCLSIDRASVPPLQGGRYFIGVYNPNNISQRVRVVVTILQDINSVHPLRFDGFGPLPIPDDAITYSSVYVPFQSRIVRAEVGVAINHPRVSDMVLTLLSPGGKRILLSENRGGPNAANMGNLTFVTNSFGTVLSGDAISNGVPFDAMTNSGLLVIDYNFETVPDTMDVYYDNTNIFSTGPISGAGSFTIPFGPGLSTQLLIVINQNGNPNPTTVWSYTPRVITQTGTYLLFSENTNFTQIPIKFAVPPLVSMDTYVTNVSLTCEPPSTNTGWVQWTNNGHWYKAVSAPGISWDQAYLMATNDCGYLATITDSNENAFVFSLIDNPAFFVGPTGSGPAIGGMLRLGTTDVWEWVTAEPFLYNNWLPGRPLGDSGTNRLQFLSGIADTPGDTWGDVPQNEPSLSGYIIERDMSPPVVAGPILNPANNHYYYLLDTNTWTESEAEAVSLGGHLVTIRSAAENSWVFGNFANVGGIAHSLWIGYNDVASPTNFVWTSGEPTNYTNWRPGEPSNTGGIEHYTYMYNVAGFEGLWNDYQNTFIIPGEPPAYGVAEVPGIVTVSTNHGAPYFPEESLQALVGDGAKGTWTLEMWDNRAGATNPPPELVSWELRLILETPVPEFTTLFPGVQFTNTIPQCQIQYFAVDVPVWPDFVTNTFVADNPPGATLWFNQSAPSTNGGQVLIAGPGAGGVATLDAASNPPLIRGTRYYLAVETPCGGTNQVGFSLQVDFGVDSIGLTNGIPLTNSFAAGAAASRLYSYNVTNSAAARAQFEILEYPDGDVTLVARHGLPPPDQFSYDYLSANPSTNGELIVVLTNSTPVVLSPGTWYLNVINITNSTSTNATTNVVSYTIKATEWPITGRPFAITNWVLDTNEFCFTWESLPGLQVGEPGAHYYLQGTPALTGKPWYKLSPTITATDYSTNYCVPMPSPFQYFRLVENLSLINVPEPAPMLTATVVTNGVLLKWIGSVTAQYEAQWAPALVPPPGWTSFTNVITTTNGYFSFLDDGTQTSGFTGIRFYRVRQLGVP